jgi:hypothetical protein
MLAANHGQNRSRGEPLRSLTPMTLIPFASTLVRLTKAIIPNEL